jgi:hypothetical protein
MKKLHIVTLFGQSYLSRGLAMIESIQENASLPLKFTVLAMDNATYDYLNSSKLHRVNLIALHEFQDGRFQSLTGVRPFRELCWTAASCLTNLVFQSDQESDFIIYVDADCFFFTDIASMIGKWGEDSNIFVHEHRYSLERKQWEDSSGKFNVGVVGFRARAHEARTCLERWRLQVLNRCELIPDKGFCGDQGYLNEWPDLYPGLQIMRSCGEGAAPWNIELLSAHRVATDLEVEDEKLIFYHFHALRISYNRRWHIIFTHFAVGYTIPVSVRKLVYRPYLKILRGINRRLLSAGFAPGDLGLKEVKVGEIVSSGNASQRLIQLLF